MAGTASLTLSKLKGSVSLSVNVATTHLESFSIESQQSLLKGACLLCVTDYVYIKLNRMSVIMDMGRCQHVQ